MKVIAKFRCREVNASEPQGIFEDSKLVGVEHPCRVQLAPVSKHDRNPTPQDEMFGRATPHGEIVMTIMNKAAAAQFVAGEDYLVSFERAE